MAMRVRPAASCVGLSRNGHLSIATLLAFALPVALVGCRAGGVPVLNLLGLDKPLVIALVAEPPAPNIKSVLTNPFDVYEPLRTELADHLNRPVAIDLCLAVQLETGLDLGFHHLAILTPTQYAAIGKRDRFEVLATTASPRAAVLLAPRDAPYEGVADLRGRAVAFGQAGDVRTHLAALALLKEHGLSALDLSLEMLPIPGSLRHVSSPDEVARQISAGEVAAGFVDERWWSTLPPKANGGEPGQDQFRVLARTAALPDRMVVASNRLDAPTAQSVRSWLLSPQSAKRDSFRRLGWSGMSAPRADLLSACARVAEFIGPAALVAK